MKRIAVMLSILALFATTGLKPAQAANQNGLVEALSSSQGVSMEQAREQVQSVFGVLSSELASGREVGIRNFGRFYLQDRAARSGRNPKTGEKIAIPAKRYPKFSSSDTLKKMVNAK